MSRLGNRLTSLAAVPGLQRPPEGRCCGPRPIASTPPPWAAEPALALFPGPGHPLSEGAETPSLVLPWAQSRERSSETEESCLGRAGGLRASRYADPHRLDATLCLCSLPSMWCHLFKPASGTRISFLLGFSVALTASVTGCFTDFKVNDCSEQPWEVRGQTSSYSPAGERGLREIKAADHSASQLETMISCILQCLVCSKASPRAPAALHPQLPGKLDLILSSLKQPPQLEDPDQPHSRSWMTWGPPRGDGQRWHCYHAVQVGAMKHTQEAASFHTSWYESFSLHNSVMFGSPTHLQHGYR